MSSVKLANIPVPDGEKPVVVVDDTSRLSGQRYAAPILRIMYGAIFCYSVLVGYIAQCPWYAMIVWYIWGLIAFLLWHYQAHHQLSWVPFNNQCYIEHKKHHWEIYPPNQFFGKEEHKVTNQTWIEYFNPIDWVTPHEGLLYILMFVPIIIAKITLQLSNGHCIGATIGYLIMGIIGNSLHHAFHVKDIWLTKYSWFHELRALHYVHHLGDARQNYAVLNMSLDRWLSSLALNVNADGEDIINHPPEQIPGVELHPEHLERKASLTASSTTTTKSD